MTLKLPKESETRSIGPYINFVPAQYTILIPYILQNGKFKMLQVGHFRALPQSKNQHNVPKGWSSLNVIISYNEKIQIPRNGTQCRTVLGKFSVQGLKVSIPTRGQWRRVLPRYCPKFNAIFEYTCVWRFLWLIMGWAARIASGLSEW